jgi:D-cysteine desulfhydrase family pyridoxal phosphate-dependent enzyme
MSQKLAALQARISSRPRARFAHLPTPLEKLRGGAAHGIWIKRDDCTGLAFGGNKARKLEFTLGDALAANATALVTASGIQSNHVRQTAAAAARLGLKFHPVVFAPLERFARGHLESGNLLLDGLMGARLHVAPTEADLDRTCDEVMRELRRQGERPYFIPLGASDGIGSVGYVEAALELLEQCDHAKLAPTHVFTATGSGGTHAGLLAGLRWAGASTAVIGLSVSEPSAVKCSKVATALAKISETLKLDPAWHTDDIVVLDAYAGAGYAHPTDAANDAVKSIARSDGILLDPVYTGKAFAGMMDQLARNTLGPVRDPIFLHTGGASVLFADPKLLWDAPREVPSLAPLYTRVT